MATITTAITTMVTTTTANRTAVTTPIEAAMGTVADMGIEADMAIGALTPEAMDTEVGMLRVPGLEAAVLEDTQAVTWAAAAVEAEVEDSLSGLADLRPAQV